MSVIPKFFLRVRKDFPENFCFSCDLKDELEVKEVKGMRKSIPGRGKSRQECGRH